MLSLELLSTLYMDRWTRLGSLQLAHRKEGDWKIMDTKMFFLKLQESNTMISFTTLHVSNQNLRITFNFVYCTLAFWKFLHQWFGCAKNILRVLYKDSNLAWHTRKCLNLYLLGLLVTLAMSHQEIHTKGIFVHEYWSVLQQIFLWCIQQCGFPLFVHHQHYCW